MPGAIHSLREVFILSETTNRLNFGVTYLEERYLPPSVIVL